MAVTLIKKNASQAKTSCQKIIVTRPEDNVLIVTKPLNRQNP